MPVLGIGLLLMLGDGKSWGQLDLSEPVPSPFGLREFGRDVDVSKIRHSRITSGFQYEYDGNLKGFNRDLPGNRFSPYWKSPRPGIEEYFPKVSPRRPADSAEDVNQPLVTKGVGSQQVPLRYPVGFFDRPDVVAAGSESVTSMPVENGEGHGTGHEKAQHQQWFRNPYRDLGVGRGSGGIPSPMLPASPPVGHLIGPMIGPAMPLSSSAAASEPVSMNPGGVVPGVVPGSKPGVSPDFGVSRSQQAAEQAAEQTAEQVIVARRRLKGQEERLEASLIGNAAVHVLSPIQISLAGNGTATVRGVVADEQSRLAVGKILLADPWIKQVNNMTTVLSEDPSQRPRPVEAE